VKVVRLVGRMKFALVSHVLPPSCSGQAVVIYRILQAIDPSCYCLISRQNYDCGDYQGGISSTLSAHYHYLPPELRLPGYRFGFFGVNSWLQTLQRARQIARIVKHERANAVVACTGDPYDLPAAYLASRWIKVRYYPYIFDDYLYQWVAPQLRSFAQRFEATLLKWADGIIVPNEFLQDDYRRRHGVEAVVIYNPCGESGPGPESKVSWPTDQGEIKVVYTGAVYHAHYDAFQNLLSAIQQIGRPEIKLHLYTEQLPRDLERENICGPVVYHHHVTLSQVVEVQEKADILFLPLAFDSPIPEVIKTSAPGKMGEYMASGRPILVHAPGDSFLSWYFKKHGCGLVVDRNEPLELSRAIQRIIDNPALRRELREKALGCAKTDFSLTAARAKFMKLFEPKVEG
jgi:glycosyltransferase involved in cell wall biosynthesis